MSPRNDRPLSQAWRYARHRLGAATPQDKLRSAAAYGAFAGQFEPDQQQRIHAVYTATLRGGLVEDRRSRGRQVC